MSKGFKVHTNTPKSQTFSWIPLDVIAAKVEIQLFLRKVSDVKNHVILLGSHAIDLEHFKKKLKM